MPTTRERGEPAGRPLQTLTAEVEKTYQETMQRMVDAIIRYIAGALGVSQRSLKKADDTNWDKALSIVTPEQIERIQQIIEDHHAGFAAGVIGPDVLRPAELERLRAEGLIPMEVGNHLFLQSGPLPTVPTPRPWPETAYDFGAYQGMAAHRDAVMAMSAAQFALHRTRVDMGLSEPELQAKRWARQNAGQYIRGAGNRVAMDVTSSILQTDAAVRRQFVGVVAEETATAIEKRKPWRQLAQDLGNRTGEWARDVRRIAATESEFARQEGQMRSMSRGREPKEIRVAKLPDPTACPDCIRLHLTAGVGSPPRIFLLSELQANGNNVGVKRADWRAGVGPVHPWCACHMVEVPDGWAFDESGTLVPEVTLKSEDVDAALHQARLLGQPTHGLLHPKAAEAYLGKAGFAENITHREIVQDKGVSIRVSDSATRALVQMVVDEAPPQIFDKLVGVTLITTDSARLANPMEDGDFAYWTGNEITINRTIEPSRVPRVLRHELGHSLNVWLFHQLGSIDAVRGWHTELDKVSQREGYVSAYAKREPIENAAEVTRMYLFEQGKLMLAFPSQFAFCHRAYKEIFE